MYTCENSNAQCMMGNCESCPRVEIEFTTTLHSDTLASDSDTTSSDESSAITYYRWMTVDKKVQKVACEIEKHDVQDILCEKIKELKQHLHVYWEQHKTYNEIKNGLKPNEILVHVDFAENYENKQQSEVQSAYFGHDSFSLFTACCYTNTDGIVENLNFVITTEAKDHSRFAAHCLIKKVIEIVRERINLGDDQETIVHLWSDRCASQYRSKYVFRVTTLFPTNWQVTR